MQNSNHVESSTLPWCESEAIFDPVLLLDRISCESTTSRGSHTAMSPALASSSSCWYELAHLLSSAFVGGRSFSTTPPSSTSRAALPEACDAALRNWRVFVPHGHLASTILSISSTRGILSLPIFWPNVGSQSEHIEHSLALESHTLPMNVDCDLHGFSLVKHGFVRLGEMPPLLISMLENNHITTSALSIIWKITTVLEWRPLRLT